MWVTSEMRIPLACGAPRCPDGGPRRHDVGLQHVGGLQQHVVNVWPPRRVRRHDGRLPGVDGMPAVRYPRSRSEHQHLPAGASSGVGVVVVPHWLCQPDGISKKMEDRRGRRDEQPQKTKPCITVI